MNGLYRHNRTRVQNSSPIYQTSGHRESTSLQLIICNWSSLSTPMGKLGRQLAHDVCLSLSTSEFWLDFASVHPHPCTEVKASLTARSLVMRTGCPNFSQLCLYGTSYARKRQNQPFCWCVARVLIWWWSWPWARKKRRHQPRRWTYG